MRLSGGNLHVERLLPMPAASTDHVKEHLFNSCTVMCTWDCYSLSLWSLSKSHRCILGPWVSFYQNCCCRQVSSSCCRCALHGGSYRVGSRQSRSARSSSWRRMSASATTNAIKTGFSNRYHFRVISLKTFNCNLVMNSIPNPTALCVSKFLFY